MTINEHQETVELLERERRRLRQSPKMSKHNAAKCIAIAIEAVERQIPLRPILEADGYADGELVYDTWYCQNCDKEYEAESEKHKYCPNCGQAIDWRTNKELEPEVDWSEVAVDTPILVREIETNNWMKRHFAKYENGQVWTWDYGKTSWTVGLGTNVTSPWRYTKLAEVNDGSKETAGTR